MADGSGSYVSQLDATFPDGDVDFVNVLDNAINKTREVLVATFGNVDGPVTATDTGLNNIPKLVHVGSAAVAAATQLVEITIEAGYDYRIVGRQLNSSAGAGVLGIRVGDGTSYETGSTYIINFYGYGSTTGAIGGANVAQTSFTTVSLGSGSARFGFDAHLYIGHGGVNNTVYELHGSGNSATWGLYGITIGGHIAGSAKTTPTRFEIRNTGADAVAGGTVLIYRLPKDADV